MKMNHTLAQEITNKVMNVIPYNVNIKDETGVIIGSGEQNRIGTCHQGAIHAIVEKKVVSVYDSLEGDKPGVNIPVQFRQKIIGVIGISGDPHYVAPFAELVRITAELLINQEFMFRERRMQEQMKEEFLYQWMFQKKAYDQAFLDLGKAIDIDCSIPRRAILLDGEVFREPVNLDHQEFMIHLSARSVLYILVEKSHVLERLTQLAEKNQVRIGIGKIQSNLSHSMEQAKKALEIAERLSHHHLICHYKDVEFIDFLSSCHTHDSSLVEIFSEMSQHAKGQELIETLVSFIENNGDMNHTSEQLHIHRNSLTYRLQKMESLTGKNPKKFSDLFQLFTAYVLLKVRGE